jgi:hypothetical protein
MRQIVSLVARKCVGYALLSVSIPIVFAAFVSPFIVKQALGLALGTAASTALCYIAHRLIAPSAESRTRRDKRAPIVYLRPFLSDQSVFQTPLRSYLLPFRFGFPETDEEAMSRTLRRLGPVIAVGNPREWLPKLGAARLYRRGRDWQDAVRDLIRSASLIVVRAGNTEGLLWELEVITNLAKPNKVIIWFPPPTRWSWRRRRVMADFRQFCQFAERMLPHPLPVGAKIPEFVYFETGWLPHGSSQSRGMWASLRAFMSRSRAPHIRRNIRQPLTNAGLRPSRLRPRLIEVANFLFYGIVYALSCLFFYNPSAIITFFLVLTGHISFAQHEPNFNCGDLSTSDCYEMRQMFIQAMGGYIGVELGLFFGVLLFPFIGLMTIASFAMAALLTGVSVVARVIAAGARRTTASLSALRRDSGTSFPADTR